MAERARAEYAETGSAPFFSGGRILLTHAAALAASGRVEEAHSSLRAARDWIDRIAASIPDADVRARFLDREETRRHGELAALYAGDA
jgi:hypothetical protein